MDKRLVDHLREGGDAAAGSSARWMRRLSPRRLRRLVASVRARPLARVLFGLAAAFACGVALGVGVAAMFAPESVETAARIAGAAGQGAGSAQADAAPYAVEVKVRQERPDARQDAREDAPPSSDTDTDTGVRLVAKPTPQPEAEAAAADLSGALPPPAVPEARPAAEAPLAEVPLVQPGVPAAEAPAQPETAAPQTEAPSTDSGLPPQPRPEEHHRLALGPAGLNGAVQPAAPGASEPPPPQPAPDVALAALPMPGDAAWIRNAVKLPNAPRDVAIAIIIDDMGIDQKRSKLVIGLPAPLTLSFIPYGYHLKELVAASRVAGHEVMLHLPMEPMDPDADPGPNALRTTVPLEENQRRIEWALTRFDGFVGLNNHMGSKFTAWKPGMELVMREVQARGLLFVDSFTNNESVGYALARQHKLPSASRDVFIDHDITRAAIEHSLKELERVARRRGYAVGIAHPHDLSREMLKAWIKEAKSRGVDFVPISHIARRGMKTG